MATIDGYALCHALLGDALNRCRHSDTLCRVTISIKHTENDNPDTPALFQVSISDTGPGIVHEDFCNHYQVSASAHLTPTCNVPLLWGGEFEVMSTGFTEEEVRHYRITDAFGNAKVMQLQSMRKGQTCYSGTDATFHLKGYPKTLLQYILHVCKKVVLLMLKNVAIEICLSSKGTSNEETIFFGDGLSLLQDISNIERLSYGLTTYILDSVNDSKCSASDHKRNSIMIGMGLARSSEVSSETQWFFEVCFAVMKHAEKETQPSSKHIKTEVIFFQDFMNARITGILVEVLKAKVNWQKSGLSVKDIYVDSAGIAIIVWDTLPSFHRIELVLHRYKSRQTRSNTWKREAKMLRESVEGALNDMKEKHPQSFLSNHAVEIQKLVPDLSRCISMLVTSSSDDAFKETCAEILGVNCTDFLVVEPVIRAKIERSIERVDQLPFQGNKNLPSEECSKCDDQTEVAPEDEDGGTGHSIFEYL